MCTHYPHTHTHTHIHIYIYTYIIYIYIYHTHTHTRTHIYIYLNYPCKPNNSPQIVGLPSIITDFASVLFPHPLGSTERRWILWAARAISMEASVATWPWASRPEQIWGKSWRNREILPEDWWKNLMKESCGGQFCRILWLKSEFLVWCLVANVCHRVNMNSEQLRFHFLVG